MIILRRNSYSGINAYFYFILFLYFVLYLYVGFDIFNTPTTVALLHCLPSSLPLSKKRDKLEFFFETGSLSAAQATGQWQDHSSPQPQPPGLK